MAGTLEELIMQGQRGSPGLGALEGVFKNVPALAGYFGGSEYLQGLGDRGRLRDQLEEQRLKQAQFEAGRAALGPGATPEDYARHAFGYLDPKTTVTSADEYMKLLQTKELKQQAKPEVVKLTEYLASLPPNHPAQQAIQDRIKQITTHQPGVNVYSGSLTAGVDAQGNPVFVQASGRPGVAPRPVEGVFPPERAAAAKAGKERAENEATVASVEERIKKMTALIQGGAMAGQTVGPLGTASRIGETAMGAVNPGQATPAIDYNNEQALLLSDVRKIVEKDPNLSNQERERLYTTLGGGFMQTPGSAIRTLNNVLEYVKSKKTTGPSRGAIQDAPTEPADRQRNKVYRTPRGNMRWTGTGWLPAN